MTAGFEPVFRAWQARRGHLDSPSYDLESQVMYLPRPEPSPSYVFDFMHEWSHAQLAEGLPGIVLENLRALLDVVRGPLADRVEGWARETVGAEGGFVHQLELGGRLPPVEGRVATAWREFRAEPSFAVNVDVFREVHRRRGALIDAFHDVHEGVAVLTAISLPLTELDDPEDWLGKVVDILQSDSGESAPEDLRPRLVSIAERERERWSDGVYAGLHGLGVASLRDLCEPGATFDDVWLFALPAMHIPYGESRPLDLSDAGFDQWIEDYKGRFGKLLSHSDRLRDCAERVRRSGTVTPDVERELLMLAAPDGREPSPEPMGTWLRRAIWESALFRRFLDGYGVPLSETESVVEPLEERFQDDRSTTFTLTRYGNPARIDEEGRVRGRQDAEERRIVMDRIESSCRIHGMLRTLDALDEAASFDGA